MSQMPTLIEQHFLQPQQVGSFDDKQKNIVSAMLGAPSTGGVVKLQLQLIGDGIIDARFKAYGCPYTIAIMSWLTGQIKDKKIQDAMALTAADIATQLQLPKTKAHCAMLAEDVLNQAIKAG